jgi:predicted membrane GTPase involved in stress response
MWWTGDEEAALTYVRCCAGELGLGLRVEEKRNTGFTLQIASPTLFFFWIRGSKNLDSSIKQKNEKPTKT